MKSSSEFAQPPRVAVWLLNLFALKEEGESILGDLLEEFSLLASKSGIAFARRWYWRQTVKTLPQLAGVGFRSAPLLTTTAIVGGFLLRKLVGPLVGPAIFAVLEWCKVYDRHFAAYLFFASTGIDIAHLLSFLAIGFVVALAAREREMVATITLGSIFVAMAVVAIVYIVSSTGNGAVLWRFPWYAGDSLAIVIAGAVVKTHRLGAAAGLAKA
jgi:hypothetical protein